MSTTSKPVYVNSAALTSTSLQSLASSSTLLAGWSSATQDNTSDQFVDCKVSGSIVTGTSPTVSTSIEVWLWEVTDDSTFPDQITGTEGAITLTSVNIKNAGGFKQIDTITVDNTTNGVYQFSYWIAQFFGGTMPKKWGVFITQNTAAALKSSTNVISKTGVQYVDA